MTQPELIIPTIHLNGTSREELLSQLQAAARATADACLKLADAAPHPRDYYVQYDTEAYTKARAQHEARLEKLRQIYNELESIAIKIG